MRFFKKSLTFHGLYIFILLVALAGALQAGPGPPAEQPAPQALVRPLQRPAPPNAREGEIMENIEDYLRATIPDPDSYEPIDFSKLVLFEEEESKAYKWGMRHIYRVSHPLYRALFVDRIFFIA
jgi:hypothetical protein